MTKPSAVPFSVRLDPVLKSRLDAAARVQERPSSYVATKAIEAYLDAAEEKQRAIEAALAEADRGAFISSEAMNAWVDSWDSETEAPLPAADIHRAKR